MKAYVKFIMDVPRELENLDGQSINVNAVADAVRRDLPVKWDAHVIEVSEKK